MRSQAQSCDEDANEPIDLQVSRFLASRSIALVLMGVPGIYLLSLFGSRNDVKAVLEGKNPRLINRRTICKEACNSILDKEAPVLDAGAGASKFIDYLVDHSYENVIAVDISEMALHKTRERLGEEKSRKVIWIIDDITKPAHVDQLSEIDLWHDRALLHFLTGDKERQM